MGITMQDAQRLYEWTCTYAAPYFSSCVQIECYTSNDYEPFYTMPVVLFKEYKDEDGRKKTISALNNANEALQKAFDRYTSEALHLDGAFYGKPPPWTPEECTQINKNIAKSLESRDDKNDGTI